MDSFSKKLYNKEYHKKHRDVLVEKSRVYYLKNRLQLLKQKRIYALKNASQIKIYQDAYRSCHRFENILYQRNYREKNRNTILIKRHDYYLKNKKRIQAYDKVYSRTEKRVVAQRLRHLLRYALKTFTTSGKVVSSKVLGIDIKNLVESIGSCPKPERISGYHIDHKIPLCYFDLNNPEQVRIAFSSDNLQWLPAEENLKKGTRIFFGGGL